jgi:hypothetical protein
MGLLYVFIASVLAASVNLCLRKNLEKQPSAQGYLAIYFFFSLAVSFLLREVKLESFSFVMGASGTAAGLLNFLMMTLTALSLKNGPSGLTFAFQNCASILPTIILFLLFGSAFSFNLTLPVLIGFILIAIGLFLSSKMQKEAPAANTRFSRWILFVISIFLLQGIILSLFQWRCLLLTDQPLSHPLIPWRCTAENEAWFMPGFFLIPTLLQAVLFFASEKRLFTSRETLLGTIGGVLNGGATYFLLLSAKVASPHERMILFPFFAVSVIFLCNLWGKKLYQEKIYWPGMALCFAGVFIGVI